MAASREGFGAVVHGWASTVHRFGEQRFLPLPACFVLPPAAGDDRLELVAPAHTTVHCIEAGVVQLVDPTQAGEIEVRSDRDRVYRYGRLVPSSIRCQPGDPVEAGQVLGAVGEAGRDGASHPSLVVTLHDGAGQRLDLARELIGLPDPLELVATWPTTHPPAAAAPASASEPAPVSQNGTAPAPPTRSPATPEDDDDEDHQAFRAMVARPSGHHQRHRHGPDDDHGRPRQP